MGTGFFVVYSPDYTLIQIVPASGLDDAAKAHPLRTVTFDGPISSKKAALAYAGRMLSKAANNIK